MATKTGFTDAEKKAMQERAEELRAEKGGAKKADLEKAARYATFGFNGGANLDDGDMWATSFAVDKLTPTVEKKMADLIKKAVS